MSKNKRYYWLKLKEDFFEDDTIQWIEEQENGKEYVIFYLKLALKSLQDDGKLIRYVGEGLIPYDTKALARLTNTNVDTVNTAMEAFLSIGLVERLETGELYMKQINEMIGSETDVARRVRKHRARQNALEQKGSEMLQSNADVTKSNTELELEIDKDIDKEKSDKQSSNDDSSLSEDFESLWKLYPNKKGKKKAKSSYKRAIKNGTTNKEIQDGIIGYKKYLKKNDWLKPAHGSTWFNNERWEDDYETEENNKTANLADNLWEE